MKRVYLLGYPLAHSVSPAMQNAAFRARGMDWEYTLLPTDTERLATVIPKLRESDCAGANVTVPLKQAVIEWLDELSESARRANAVNTIINRQGRLLGDNTDTVGFMISLRENHIHPRNATAAILGAGGAAAAVCFALAGEGARGLTIVNRDGARAAELADRLHAYFPRLELAVNWNQMVSDVNLLVNATSVGMHPNISDSPMPHGQAFSSRTIVIDVVYNPPETRFLIDARNSGARTIGGLGMLAHQGAAAFRVWTDSDAPLDVMKKAAIQALRQAEYALHKT